MPRAASLAAATSTASRYWLCDCDVTTSSELDHALAAVLARQQSDQRLRRVLEAVDDVLLHLQLAGRDPGLEVGERTLAFLHVIHHDEALHDEPLHHDQAGHAAWTVCGRRAVILRDRAAAGDAAVIVHLRQAGFENVAADIVEINVDALWRGCAQRLENRAVLVVDGRIEAELGGQPVALVRAAGNADHATPPDLGDLSHDRTDRARGRRDHDGFALLGLADLKQAEIGGQAGDAE